MQKIKDITLIAVIIVWAIMMFKPSNKTNYTPATFTHLRTDLQHPDTFYGYWDHGALYLVVATYHEDTVAEYNQ